MKKSVRYLTNFCNAFVATHSRKRGFDTICTFSLNERFIFVSSAVKIIQNEKDVTMLRSDGLIGAAINFKATSVGPKLPIGSTVCSL